MPKSIPTIGDPNWGTPLNTHLSQLQNPNNGGINSFEQFSGRPTTLTLDDIGKTYIYTQTGNLHQWTGTTWKVLNESVINVKDYGAIGDGVTDDTVAIRLSITKGSKVYIPAGTYLTETITFPYNFYPHRTPELKPLEIIGESMYDTIILQKVANQTLVQFDGYPSYGHILSNFAIKPNSASNGGVAVDMTGCIRCRVENIQFVDNGTGYFEEGISLHGVKAGLYITCHENFITNITVNTAIGPVKLINVGTIGYGGDAPNLNYFDRINVQSCNFPSSKVKYAIYANSGINLYITNSHFEGINGTAIFFGDFIKACCVTNCYIEANQKSIENSGGSLVSVYNCYISESFSEGSVLFENKIIINAPINFIGCFGDNSLPTSRKLGLKNQISSGVVTIDHLAGGINGGAMLEISSNAYQGLLQFNQYYGDFNNTGLANRRARVGAAGQIMFAPNDVPFSDSKAGDMNFSISSSGNSDDPITYKKILSLNQKSVNMPSILEFADNSAAITGGLILGDTYRTGDLLKIVH